MKLKQNEYCHNCQKYVDFEFDDVTERQVIICPSCGHEHWREIDEGTILQFRINPDVRTIRIAKPKPMTTWFAEEGSIAMTPMECEIEEREVIGNSNGQPIVKAKDGEDKTKIVSNRRWGVDRRQI